MSEEVGENFIIRGEVERALANYASLVEIPETTNDDLLKVCNNTRELIHRAQKAEVMVDDLVAMWVGISSGIIKSGGKA